MWSTLYYSSVLLGIVKVIVVPPPSQHWLEENQQAGTRVLGGDGACPLGRLPAAVIVLTVARLWEAPDSHHSRMLVGANSSPHPESSKTEWWQRGSHRKSHESHMEASPHLFEPVVTVNGANYKRPGFLGQGGRRAGHKADACCQKAARRNANILPELLLLS